MLAGGRIGSPLLTALLPWALTDGGWVRYTH
jgi:hypothetical protein